MNFSRESANSYLLSALIVLSHLLILPSLYGLTDFWSLYRYWRQHLRELDYDELVYGHDRLSEIAEKHPNCLGIIQFFYIILG
jgi:hypothetical protein